jgi:Concanavalin A-like lectin/glucanases superfamily
MLSTGPCGNEGWAGMRSRRTALALAAVVSTGGLLLAAPGAQAAPPPTSGWVLGYGFESVQGGVVHDASPSAITATLRGTTLPVTATSRAGHGRALALDSAKRQFVDVPDSAVLDVDHYTLTAWVRYLPKVHDDRWEVVEKADAYWMNIRTDTRKLRAGGFFGSCDSGVKGTWRYVDSATAIPAYTWVHVASTYDGATLRIYVNGVLDRSLAVTGRTCANAEPVAIGAKNKTSAGLLEAFFDGRIDDFRIYDHPLTAAQIKAVRAAATP